MGTPQSQTGNSGMQDLELDRLKWDEDQFGSVRSVPLVAGSPP